MQEKFFRLSAFVRQPLTKGETLIFFDEVQVCPEVVTLIKGLVDEGSYCYAEVENLSFVFFEIEFSCRVSYRFCYILW